MAADLVQIISDLLTGGLPVLLLYLYFTERMSHKETRDRHAELHQVLAERLIDIQKSLYEARIADYKLWLEFQNDIIVSGRLSTQYNPQLPPAKLSQAPAPKTPPKSTSIE